MFGVNWSNPETLWLNLTNLALGVVVLLAVMGVAYTMMRDVFSQLWSRRTESNLDREVRKLLATESHAFFEPELGLTMADGGEREDAADKKKNKER